MRCGQVTLGGSAEDHLHILREAVDQILSAAEFGPAYGLPLDVLRRQHLWIAFSELRVTVSFQSHAEILTGGKDGDEAHL